MAETLEQSDYTSVQSRVQAIKATALEAGSSGELRPDVERAALEYATPARADAFLAPVTIHERKAPFPPMRLCVQEEVDGEGIGGRLLFGIHSSGNASHLDLSLYRESDRRLDDPAGSQLCDAHRGRESSLHLCLPGQRH
jgi:hypothetical protein